MTDIEHLPELDIATTQLSEIRSAITSGNYSSLQGLLLGQALALHKIGMEFVDKSDAIGPIRHKSALMDIALRSFSQSQKTMATIKLLKKEK